MSADAAPAARATRLELERLVDAEAPTLRTWLSSATFGALERYTAALLEANQRLNLTRIVEPTAVARLHLLDAIAALPILDELGSGRALDLGAGGGVPGLVLAIARPDVSWTLVDAERRKAEALRTFASELGLPTVTVVGERAETLGHDGAFRGQFDLVTARACAPLPVLVEYALPLLDDGGALVAWKGELSGDELGAGQRAAAQLGGSEPELRPSGVPSLGDHRFAIVRRSEPMPSRFPRRPGVPSRRPLG